MVVVFLGLVLAPFLLWTRGRKDISNRALSVVFLYYIIASYFVDGILDLRNTALKAAAITVLLSAPVALFYRESIRRILASAVTSFLLIFLLFQWYSTDTPYIPPAAPLLSSVHPRDIPEALGLLKTQQRNKTAVISAVLYLREVSGLQIGNEPARWEQWYQGTGKVQVSRKATKTEPELIRDGFSAVKALNMFRRSEQTGEDFLGLLLGNTLPARITTRHLHLLTESVDRLDAKSDSTKKPEMFRRGMAYFFLALAQSQALAQGENLDAETISNHWGEALKSLKDSEIGNPMAQSLETALKEVDGNGDGKWNPSELKTLIKRRSTTIR